MITIYLVLLFAIPSNVSIAALGSLGRPALLWGAFLMFWWVIHRIQTRVLQTDLPRQPVRWAYGALLTIALFSFAAAMLRGQPPDQLNPAIASLVRLLSWGGVLLVTLEGLRSKSDVEQISKRLVLAGALLASFGLIQFATGQSMLDWIQALPGMSVDLGGVDSRGAFVRASATATHPLEYTAAIITILPIAVAFGFKKRLSAESLWTWIPAGLIILAALLSVSRSAIISLIIAMAALIPGLPKARRWILIGGGLIASAMVVILVPGVLSTTLSLFAEAGTDPSTQSRTGALERAPDFILPSPLVGLGFGTFLPRYYIFDNQWVLILVELGILGASALASIALSAMWSARIRTQSSNSPRLEMGAALSASMLTISVCFIFFDALSFPMAGGIFFLVAGLCGAWRSVSAPVVTGVDG